MYSAHGTSQPRRMDTPCNVQSGRFMLHDSKPWRLSGSTSTSTVLVLSPSLVREVIPSIALSHPPSLALAVDILRRLSDHEPRFQIGPARLWRLRWPCLFGFVYPKQRSGRLAWVIAKLKAWQKGWLDSRKPRSSGRSTLLWQQHIHHTAPLVSCIRVRIIKPNDSPDQSSIFRGRSIIIFLSNNCSFPEHEGSPYGVLSIVFSSFSILCRHGRPTLVICSGRPSAPDYCLYFLPTGSQ